LPNGNVLMIVWDKKTAKEAIAAGRRPGLVDDYLLPDAVLEIKPTGKTTGKVVWEWHLWDHLIQDYDKSKANYGNVAEHPELVDINYSRDLLGPVARSKDGLAKLKSIGYAGSTKAAQQPVNPEWTHTNAVAYNAKLDQVVLSVHGFSEIWIIDHSTTTDQAASHQGGRSGKGGDLLYRWGNPRAYRAGTAEDQQFFGQHSAYWIPEDYPGEGHLLVFNNGMGRTDANYSSVDELILPVNAKGEYTYQPGFAYAPKKPAWSYSAPGKSDFYSMIVSGAQRLPNGNTLICSGVDGTLFEVTPHKEMVWTYVKARPVGDFRSPGPMQGSAEQMKQMRAGFGRGGPGPFGLAPGPGPGGMGGFLPPNSGSVFRVYRYSANYPAFAGKHLTVGQTIEELEWKELTRMSKR
jgi:hypothetical protein